LRQPVNIVIRSMESQAQDVAVNVAAVSNAGNYKTAEEHINKVQDKSSAKHMHTTITKHRTANIMANRMSVRKEVTSKK